MKAAIGVDVGGTKTAVGMVREDGKILSRTEFPTTDYDDGVEFASNLAETIKSTIAQGSAKDDSLSLVGAGVGAPNGNHHSGCIEEPPNLKFKGNTPLVRLLESRLSVPKVDLTNDANAAAIGEKIFGAAKKYQDFVMVTLGTGLGSGVYVDNKLVYGHDGFAGELGHVTVVPGGRNCGFGRKGSLENYCSATGIRRTFFEMISIKNNRTLLDEKKISEITAKDIADAAYEGDPTAIATMAYTGEMLGKALASAALITSPAAFFLFGGPVNAGDLLLDPTRAAFEEHLIPPFKNKIEIIKSALPMGDAAILGAAALVLA